MSIMIDNLRSAAKISDSDLQYVDNKEFVKLGKLMLVAIRCRKGFDILKYECVIDNLLFTIRNDQLIISNSLHKFALGNNYSDFTLSDLVIAIQEIEELTGIQASLFDIKKLEFGLNILAKRPGTHYLSSFADFKTKEYDKMKFLAFWYGIKYRLSEYNLKIYDKTEHQKLAERIKIKPNILRFELQFNKPRAMPETLTLEDLKKEQKLERLFEHFIKQIKLVNCRGDEDFSETKSKERALYFAGMNNEFWKYEKSLNINTAKSKRKKYKTIQFKVSPRNIMTDFTELLTNKFNFLVNN